VIEPTLLYLYLTVLTAVYLSPGPDMALVLAVSASQGKRSGFNTAIGIAVARAMHVLGSGLGLAALFATHPNFQEIVRVAGAGYLLFWVWKMLRSPTMEMNVSTTVFSLNSEMLRGFLTNLLNPKALLFCSLLLPQFTSPEKGMLLFQFILLGGVLVSIGLLFDIIYIFLADGLVQRLGNKMNNGTPFRSRLEKARNWLLITVVGGMAIRLLVG
jgi:threonine/homoserine/homoserine lactone efflux protein